MSTRADGDDAGSEAGIDTRRNLRIRLAYDGTRFHGWQVQPGVRTVQGEVSAALQRVVGEPVRLVGASRTDAGTHARGQVASARVRSSIRCGELRRALDALTGDDVATLGVEDAPTDFHARFSSVGKRYRYRIRNVPPRDPWSRTHAWHIRRPLDTFAVRSEAAALLGTHDFSSFQAVGSPVASPIRELRSIDVIDGGEEVAIVLVANGFLRHMVRNIVGTLIEVGLGHRPSGSTLATLLARDRAAAGATAPAHGLWLEEVFYPPDTLERPIPR